MIRKPSFTFAALSLAALAGGLSLATSHEARAAENTSNVICSQTSEGFPVCTGTIGEGGGGPSILAYAAPLAGGGWTEVYDDGDWWVDHNPDGSVTIGSDDGESGLDFGQASYIKGPSLPQVPGSYQGKSKPSTAGKPTWKGPKRSLAALKAANATKTGAFSTLTPAQKSITLGQTEPSVDVSFAGTGTCKGFLVVTKDGKLVSTSGMTSFSFPSKKAITLPKQGGKYKVELIGNQGCMGAKAATEVNVLYTLSPIILQSPTRRAEFGRMMRRGDRHP